MPRNTTKQRAVERANNAARKHVERAIELHVEAMEDEGLPMDMRLKAANAILDRGIGKPTQHSTIESNETKTVNYQHLIAVKKFNDDRDQLMKGKDQQKIEYMESNKVEVDGVMMRKPITNPNKAKPKPVEEVIEAEVVDAEISDEDAFDGVGEVPAKKAVNEF